MTDYLVAAIIGAAVAGFAAWEVQDARIARIKTQYAEAQGQATAQAMATTAQMQKDKDDAIQQAQERAQQNAAAAAAARRAADGLRAQLASAQRIASATPAAVAEYATTSGELLAECGAEITELAAKADGHANDVRTLIEAWPSRDPLE